MEDFKRGLNITVHRVHHDDEGIRLLEFLLWYDALLVKVRDWDKWFKPLHLDINPSKNTENPIWRQWRQHNSKRGEKNIMKSPGLTVQVQTWTQKTPSQEKLENWPCRDDPCPTSLRPQIYAKKSTWKVQKQRLPS